MSINLKTASIFTATVALVCLLRFAFFYSTYLADSSMIVIADSYGYIDLAKSLFEQGQFLSSTGNFGTRRTPIYPLLLAATYYPFGLGELLPTIIIQQIVFFSMVMISAYLAFQLAGVSSAVIAATLLLLDFTSFYFVNAIHTETWYTLFILLTVLFFFKGQQSSEKILNWWLGASICLAIATIIRPTSLYLVYLVTIFAIAYLIKQSPNYKRAIIATIFIGLPPLLIIGFWYFRNYLVSGHFVLTSIQGELLPIRALSMMVTKYGIPASEAIQHLPENLQSRRAPLIDHLEFYFQNIGLYIKESFLSMGRTLFSPGQELLQTYLVNIYHDIFALEKLALNFEINLILGELSKRPLLYLPIILLVLTHALILFFGAIGSLCFLKVMQKSNFAIILPAIIFSAYFLFIAAVFVGSSRFRVPFTPLMAILAGYCISQIIAKFSRSS